MSTPPPASPPKRHHIGIRFLLAIILTCGWLIGSSLPASAADDYPHKDAVDCSAKYGQYSWCVNGNWYSSRLFAYRNCTDWVAWRLATTNGISDFGNHWGGRQWGNANTWDDTARALGIRVDSAPARGAVAQTDAGGFGHVAWVSSVNGDGTVTVEEYNYGGGGTYHVRTVAASAFVYLHIRDLPDGDPFGAYDSGAASGPGQVRVAGWAIDRSDPTTPIDVHVYVNGGQFVGAYHADVSRPDVAAAFPGSGDRHGFDVTFSLPAGRYSVCVYAINVGAGSQNPLLGCKDTSVASGDPFGSLDEVSSPRPGKVKVRGWAVDPSDLSLPIHIHIYVGGRAGSGAPGYDIGTASRSRPDVAAAVPGAGDRHGFERTLTAPAGTYPVCAYAINIGGGVTNTELLCRDVTVLPALSASTPTIVGAARVGATLTAHPGTWGPAPVDLHYQWKRNGAAVAGATGSTYRLGATDAKATITVTVTGSKSGFPSTSRTSRPTGKVALGKLRSAKPTISGTSKVGKTLTAHAGSWGPAPVTLKYQWRADGKKISGATKSTLKLTRKQRSAKITVRVTGSKKGYASTGRTSNATRKIR